MRSGVIAGLGIPIKKETFLKRCIDELFRTLHVRFHTMPRRSFVGELFYFADDTQAFASPTGKDKDPVPIVSVPGTKEHCWIAIGVLVDSAGRDHVLSQGAIRMYTGLDPNKTLRLRAEWDLRESNSAESHAQPHWHAHSIDGLLGEEDQQLEVSKTGMGQTFVDAETRPSLAEALRLESRRESPQEEPPDEFAEQAKIHLAMVAGWHLEKDPGCVVTAPNAESIPRWLAGTAAYLWEQLQYVAEKAGW